MHIHKELLNKSIVETKRLLLRPVTMSDADALLCVFGDAEVMHYSAGVKTVEGVQQWIRDCSTSYAAHGYGPWALVVKSSGEVIGYCGLFYFEDVNGRPEVEVGYRLARAYWDHGYATEAVRAVRDYAFASLGLMRLIALIDPGNLASIRVAEKAGMHYKADVMFAGYDHPDRVYVVENG